MNEATQQFERDFDGSYTTVNGECIPREKMEIVGGAVPLVWGTNDPESSGT